jgi:hypothetical protein
MKHRITVVAVMLVFATASGLGCGESGDAASSDQQGTAQNAAALDASREARAEARRERIAARREARRARIRAQRRAAHRAKVRAERRAAREAARAAEDAAAQADSGAQTSKCDPNYSGACLDPNAYDYDCTGGSGDGPDYTGPVQVVGDDHYGLDRDGDGYACE